MPQSSQVRLQPGSTATSLDEYMRQATLQVTPFFEPFVLAAPAQFFRLQSSALPGLLIAPFNQATTYSDTQMASLTGSAIAAYPVSSIGAGVAVPSTETRIFNYARVPVVENATGDEVQVVVNAKSQRVYAVAQCLSSVSFGATPGGSGSETVQWTFCYENAGGLVPVALPAGTYRTGLPTLTQERHRGVLRFSDGSIFSDPVNAAATASIFDEILMQVTTLIPKNTSINIVAGTVGTGGLVRTTPTGQGFDLSAYATHAAFEADSNLQIFVGGTVALKMPVASLPASTSETAIERVDNNSIRASIDLWPGTWVRVRGPRVEAINQSPAFTGEITYSILDGTSTAATIVFTGSAPFAATWQIINTSTNALVSEQAIQSGVPVNFTTTSTTRYLRLNFAGVTNNEQQRIQSISFSDASRIIRSDLNGISIPAINQSFNGQLTQNTLTESYPGLATAFTNTFANFSLTNGMPRDVVMTGAKMSVNFGNIPNSSTLVDSPSTKLINFANSQLPLNAAEYILSRLNVAASTITGCTVNLTGTPGAGSINLANYPNFASKNITVLLA